ncbi:MAG: hypothetical protein R3Y57_07215 [Erysipelotrichaceae bacterium]
MIKERNYTDFDYLQRFGLSLDLMGFNTEIVEIPDIPLSVEFKILGYEDMPIDAVAMFLPVPQDVQDQVSIFQIYISLYDEELSITQFLDLENLCNHFNTNGAVGCYGVQEELGRICYKHSLIIRNEIDIQTALQLSVDALILMSLSLDKTYQTLFNKLQSY